MSADGAHQGVTAGRAIKTILSGDPPPGQEEQMGAAEFCAWIRSAPDRPTGAEDEDGYTECGRTMAKFVLQLLDAEPEAIKLDPHQLIDRAVERFPEAKENADELTGFLAGWAVNAARRCVEMPPVPNPAILTAGGQE